MVVAESIFLNFLTKKLICKDKTFKYLL